MTSPASPPVPPDWGSWERSTLARQKLLQPYWDWQIAEKFPEDR